MTSLRAQRNAQLDLELLLDAVQARIVREGCSIRSVCRDLGISPGTITRLKESKAPDAFALISILAWLDMPAARLLSPQLTPLGVQDGDTGKPLPANARRALQRAREADIELAEDCSTTHESGGAALAALDRQRRG